jgi:hypothetical protein
MSGKAARIRLTEKQQRILERISHSFTAPQRLVRRARLILLAFAHWLNAEIASEIGLDPKTGRRVEESVAGIFRGAGGHRMS